MVLQVKIHTGDNLLESKEVIERLVNENIENKLDTWIKKFIKDDSEWIIDFKIDKNKKGLFNARIQANLDWNDFRFEREDFKNLDDLINHLFEHFKEQLTK